MKNRINNITKTHMLLGLTAITALCMASPVQAGTSNPSHRGGPGGGLPFYATASTVSQLIVDINYANSVGGAITINLAPGATFDLTGANNTTDGGNGLPVIGGANPINLTIIGNGDIIERIAVIRHNTEKNPFRLFEVAPGASLTLDHVALKGGSVSGTGGAVLNHGTLNVLNGSNLSGNGGTDIYNQGALTVNGSTVGGIYNSGSGATVNASTLGGIYNQGTMTISDSTGGHFDNEGTMTVNNSTLSGSGYAGGGIFNAGAMTLSNSTVFGSGGFYCYYGGGIYNSGSAATMTISVSTVSGNSARYGGGIYNNAGTLTIINSTLSDNSAHHYDYPWAGGYGGGIYNSGGTVVIDTCILTGNSADATLDDVPAGGDDIYNAFGTVTVKNSGNISVLP